MNFPLLRQLDVFSIYSQTWELRPPKGLGVSGPIFQVVLFARFGSKNFNMELYTCPCASHDISDRWFPRVSGATTLLNGACKRDDRSFGVPAKEKLHNQKSVFRSILRMWSLFAGWIDALGRPSVSAIRISQVVAFSRTHSVHLNPRNGLKLCVRNFQVVARTGSTVDQMVVGLGRRLEVGKTIFGRGLLV